MNIHTEPASILSAFWRRGRQSFVPLTVRELIHQHGATAHAISTMVAAGLIRREEFSKDRETAICTITEAGRRLVPQPVAAPKAKRADKPAPAKPAKAPKPAPVQAVVQPYRVPRDLSQVYAGQPAGRLMLALLDTVPSDAFGDQEAAPQITFTDDIIAAMNALAKHERRMGKLPNHRAEDPAEFLAMEVGTMMPATTSLKVAELAEAGPVDIAGLPAALGLSESNVKSCLKYMAERGIIERTRKQLTITADGLKWLAAQRELAKSEGGRVTMLRAVVNGYTTSAELVEVMGRSRPTINRIAVELVNDGLLSRERVEGQTNSGFRRLSVTEAGFAYLEAHQ